MHNGFVNIDNQKMSKSLGNSFFIKDALKSYDGEVLRFYLLSIHYRNDFNFNEEDLKVSKKRLDKIYRLKKRVYGGSSAKKPNPNFAKELIKALSDDINISVALSVIDDMIMSVNDKLDSNPSDKALKKETLANIDLIIKLIGIGYNDPYQYFQSGIDENLKSKIVELIAKRNEAKKSKDYATSDKIRDELNNMGISIMDTANGTIWEVV
jgi:cysteinyl-tRNA synthetase